jgi:hypothetical protein
MATYSPDQVIGLVQKRGGDPSRLSSCFRASGKWLQANTPTYSTGWVLILLSWKPAARTSTVSSPAARTRAASSPARTIRNSTGSRVVHSMWRSERA